ncbi:MAG: hypothetical protein GTN78_19845 [Gemmatimonadales bacterium]|nr:hypothetical protein [Gemmatimonadales bacterium]NIN12627.1 hypothetical protein [Gemmatimonadales bacterium]NIR02420.1 hypothetical protein [Gemmatimonadales bacterium]NIS66211.1 hypothetical protein [Gemmatimonadales bacterium]
MSAETDVDRYLSCLDAERRAALSALRALIRRVVPAAVECVRYRMPTCEFKGSPLCAFAARKQYMSLYIHTRLFPKYKEHFKGLSMGKECVRFRRLEELPLEAVGQILDEAAYVERA